MELQKITKEEMESVLSLSKSMREVILKFNLSANGSGGYRNIKKKIIDLGINVPKYNYHGNGVSRRKINDCDIFCENSTYPRQSLKRRIINDKLLNYECVECGNNGSYNGKLLSLHLDHKNGINNDNRLENLRFLCPNCHSQTETYAGKSNKQIKIQKESKNNNNKRVNGKLTQKELERAFKQRKVERPSKEILLNEIKEFGYRGTGRKYGVSDNAIRKWVK